MSEDPDWASWLMRWEAQQSGGLPAREERFELMLDAVRAGLGEAPTVVDLGCGPGSLTLRLVDRLPDATVFAVDADPLLLELGRRAIGDRDGQIHWMLADLRDPGWIEALPRPVDGAVSTTALHWLSPEELTSLLRRLAAAIRPGGLFLNGDHMSFDPQQTRLTDLVRHVRDDASERQVKTAGAEDWHAWWAAVDADPGFQALLAERKAGGWGGHPNHHHPAEHTFLLAALLRGGFAEADTVWQRLDNRVVAAIR